MTSISYEEDEENFPNPERGFFAQLEPNGNNPAPPLTSDKIQELKTPYVTLLRRYYLMSEFREKPLSDSFLEKLSSEFNNARESGIKLILVFTYNWLGGGPDASKARILSHIEQLEPILENNYDVIAYMEAGFIGYWGEWNRSTNGLDASNVDKTDILYKILSALPTQRMVALRYPYYKRDIFQDENPLSSEEAFNGTFKSRTGAVNNCFLASIDDWGTYNAIDPESVADQKSYLNLDNRFVVQGGEVCYLSVYDDCPNALKDLETMRWSALNLRPVDGWEMLKDWEKQGCMPEIKRRLGYRFRLIESKITQEIKPGGIFAANIKLTNDGWASPYNRRNVEIILRHNQSGKEYYLPLQVDPRLWMSGKNQQVNITAGIPDDIALGEYDVLLNLPDPAPKLYDRPEYSIRLANKNVWEASTGYNSLLTSININENVSGENYQEDSFFKEKN